LALRTWLAAFIASTLVSSAPLGAEPSAKLPGGAATAGGPRHALQSFIQLSAGMGIERASAFREGQMVFGKRWKPEEGLGPLYNARTCAICHPRGGRGRPPVAGRSEKDNASTIVRLLAPRGRGPGEIIYGQQLQPRAVAPIRGEGRVAVAYAETPVRLSSTEVVRLRQPRFDIVRPAYGALPQGIVPSARVAPQLIGAGLLDAVPEAEIRRFADPGDRDGNGISGRVSEVPAPGGGTRLGRFGWKAETASLHEQVARAFHVDMGLSTHLFPYPAGDCTQEQKDCLAFAESRGKATAEPEVSDVALQSLIGFCRELAVPPRDPKSAAAEAPGEALFAQVGCVSCHRPSLTTGHVEDRPHLSWQTIWPYTDLLLHDMGPGLADQAISPLAEGSEWRTPPLWGIGLTEQILGEAHYLHDGRARSLVEAILWHDGEARSARESFVKLSRGNRDLLIRFLRSL
jgi:CxxC motif-containing protein (DUF1111 family)